MHWLYRCFGNLFININLQVANIMRDSILTKEDINQIVESKEIGYRFMREHGVRYHGFRTWLKRHHDEGMMDIKGYEELYVRYYKRFLYRNKRFDVRYGILYATFRDWLMRNYGLNMSEIEDVPVYVREYKNWKRRKRHAKRN